MKDHQKDENPFISENTDDAMDDVITEKAEAEAETTLRSDSLQAVETPDEPLPETLDTPVHSEWSGEKSLPVHN